MLTIIRVSYLLYIQTMVFYTFAILACSGGEVVHIQDFHSQSLVKVEWTELSCLPNPTNATVVAIRDTIYVLAGFQKYGYNFSNGAPSAS